MLVPKGNMNCVSNITVKRNGTSKSLLQTAWSRKRGSFVGLLRAFDT